MDGTPIDAGPSSGGEMRLHAEDIQKIAVVVANLMKKNPLSTGGDSAANPSDKCKELVASRQVI